MMHDLLIRAGQTLYGERWQTPLAADLGVSDRTMRRWVAGTTPTPPALRNELVSLIRSRRSDLSDLETALTSKVVI